MPRRAIDMPPSYMTLPEPIDALAIFSPAYGEHGLREMRLFPPDDKGCKR